MIKTRRIEAASIFILILTASCFGSSTPIAQPNAVATVVAATMLAITPLNTATPFPAPIDNPTSAIPTNPPKVSTPEPPIATRINFLTDATTGIVSGPIQPNESQFYVLNASQGQPMIVMVNSLNNDVTLSVKTQGGTSMLSQTSHLTSWETMLPQTEDYYIGVYGGQQSKTIH